MITERAQLAQQIRAEGAEEAQKIRAQAERRRTEILATAEEESQKVRGAADANRNSIFAAAYGRDPEFFAFYRSLNSYETALKGQNGETTILLSPNSEFLRYLDNQQGRRR
jgi:membrane protease subunit HflC